MIIKDGILFDIGDIPQDLDWKNYYEKVEEEACSSPECAEGFLENIAEFLDAIAAAHSYLDMEGSFSISYHGVEDTFRFRSEAGSDLCDIE